MWICQAMTDALFETWFYQGWKLPEVGWKSNIYESAY